MASGMNWKTRVCCKPRKEIVMNEYVERNQRDSSSGRMRWQF
jgi:hypothetical protein